MEEWQKDHHSLLAQHGQQIKSLEKRMEAAERMQESISSLAMSVAVMSSQMQEVRSDTAAIKTSVDNLKELPAKRWETIVVTAITAIASAIIGAVIMKLSGGI